MTRINREAQLMSEHGLDDFAAFLVGDSDAADAVKHPAFPLLENAASECTYADDQVKEYAASLADRMERVAEAVAGRQHLNMLGEVQGSGAQLDVAVAIREEKHREFKRLVILFNKMGGMLTPTS